MKLKITYLKELTSSFVYEEVVVDNAFIHDNGFIYAYEDKGMSSKLKEVINMHSAVFIKAEVL